MTTSVRDRIVILDFGGQYTHLIANRVRRLNVFTEIILPSQSPSNVDLAGVTGLILSGGPSSVYADDQPPCDSAWFDLDLPMLGLCYGHQLLARHLGGHVARGQTQEYGIAALSISDHLGVLEGLDDSETVWMSHGDAVQDLPPGFTALAGTRDCPIAAMGNPERQIYGLQFHPEVTHTVHGMKVLENFVRITGSRHSWTMEQFIPETEDRIRQHVGDRNVFLLISGGVDSSVCFALLTRALGEERVIGLHVDNGFMRLNESSLVETVMNAAGFDNLHVVNASERFLANVAGVSDPQEKRQIIGDTFIDVQQDEVARMGLDPDHWILGQGTLYPDIIESGGTQHAAVIKTHHNRVDIIRELLEDGKVIEPLDQLYKDEVRQVGRQLGLQEELVARHPFPGPGLSVRCLCSDGSQVTVSEADRDAVRAIAREYGLEGDILPIRSVGVQGDGRTYAHPAALVGETDWDTLEAVSTALTNSVSAVNRAVWLCSPGRLPEMRIHEGYLSRDRLDALRLADDVSMTALDDGDVMDAVFQFPTILAPLGTTSRGESIVLRPLESTDVMTARFARLPDDVLRQIVDGIRKIECVDAIFYDVTNKPPATMEWE